LCTEGIRRFRRDQRKDANSSKPSVPFGQSQRRIQVSLAARDSPPSGSRSSLAILRPLIRQRCPQLRRRQCRTLACELNRITGTFGHENATGWRSVHGGQIETETLPGSGVLSISLLIQYEHEWEHV